MNILVSRIENNNTENRKNSINKHLIEYFVNIHFQICFCFPMIQYWFCSRRMPAQSTPYMAIIAGIFCIFALLLPTQPECKEDETNIPTYLHLSVNLKLVFAYVLGLVSFVVLRLQ